MGSFRHPHYFSARREQVMAADIADAKRQARTMLRLGCIRREDAVSDLRAAGCYEAEIAQVLA